MSISAAELRARAKKRYAQIQRRKRDPRYRRVLGRLCAAGHLTTNFPVEVHHDLIRVDDALWVGAIEPRVLELLPALIVKAPSLFEDTRNLPDDLSQAVRALRHHETPEDFRGIPGEDLLRWLPRVGRKGKWPSRLKAFRLQVPDLELLKQLSTKLGVTETEVVRRGLRALAPTVLFDVARVGKVQHPVAPKASEERLRKLRQSAASFGPGKKVQPGRALGALKSAKKRSELLTK